MNILNHQIFTQDEASAQPHSLSYEGEYATKYWVKRWLQNV